MVGRERHEMNAREIGLELIELVREVSLPSEGELLEDLFDEERQLPVHKIARSPFHSHADDLVERLFSIILEDGWKPDQFAEEVAAGENWSIGRVTERAAPRQIHKGFLAPRRILPLVSKVPEIVVYFLITLPGGKDFLDREHHWPVGWHYHYLDKNMRRSDVILCWDTRWVPTKPCQLRPFFQERHGAGKAHFKARPELWADPKCKSMHFACASDLTSKPIKEFRCAANKANAVWPRGSVLTPKVQN